MLSLYDLKNTPRTWRIAYIPKKSGGRRKLTIPNDDLKDLQSDILQYLYELVRQKRLQVSAVAHGFVPYHSCLTSVLKHDRTSDIFIGADMEKAFDTLQPAYPLAKLLDAGVRPEYAKEIIDVCTYENSLPQGGPASPFLLNIAMFDADCEIAAYAKKNGFLYTRYADDLLFSVKDCNPAVLKTLRQNEEKPEAERSQNPFLWFLYGVDTILKNTVNMHLNHKKDHVIFRGSKCKPYILGICVRQDGHGYNAERRFREQTRCGICNLYHKVFDTQHGVAYDADIGQWLTLKGRVEYMDYCRTASEAGYDFVDPRVQDKFFNPLERKFNAILGEAAHSTKG